MSKFLRVLLFTYGCLVSKGFGFQPLSPVTTSRSKGVLRSTSLQQPRLPRQQLVSPWMPSTGRPKETSVTVYMFGAGSGGFGGNKFGPPPPIKSKMDVLQRLSQLVVGVLRQFMSGCISGYVLGSIWGVIRGPSLKVASRGVAWGLDFGVLSALFTGTTSVADFIMALPTSPNGSDNNEKDASKKMSKRRQRTSLWSVVIRNMILAVYFARGGSIAKMVRSTLFYGGLTYYFVGSKIKRDAQGMSMFGGSPGGMNMGSTGQPSAAAMQQLMQQIMTMQQQQGPTPTTKPSSPPRQPSASTSTGASSTPSNAPPAPPQSPAGSPLFHEKNASKKANAVDVEFEPVDTDMDDNLKP